MKKITLLVAALMLTIGAQAQLQEASPVLEPNGSNTQNSLALFDLLFDYDIGSTGSVGADGLAGVIRFGDVYWVSEWQTDQIHVLDATGAFVETFAIPGISGTRSFTTNGTSIFIGTAGTSIFEVDPATRMFVDEIAITTSSDAEARMCTYDPNLDGGNGGFWIGDFGSDIASVSMTGAELSVIPSGTHGTAIYGGAVDNESAGGPFLWIHNQDAAGGQDYITQLDPVTGNPTGVQYDYILTDAPTGVTGIAGGLFINDNGGGTEFVGVCQCTPSNRLFGLELTTLGTDDNLLSQTSIFPNPASDVLNIKVATGVEVEAVAVYDVLGKQSAATISNGQVNISSLAAGVYVVNIKTSAGTISEKFVKQ